MAASSTIAVPATATPHPPLPIDAFNPHLENVQPADFPQVKFQVIVREDQEVVIGRLKITTPKGHAFVLRRCDSQAFSVSTMFRAAYPTASTEAEKAAMDWVKTNFILTGANGLGPRRLAGLWVPDNVAAYLAPIYGLDAVVSILGSAVPDPKLQPRKSASRTPASAAPSPASNNTSPAAPAPTKRRRAESPAPASTSTPRRQTRASRAAPTSPTPITAASPTTTATPIAADDDEEEEEVPVAPTAKEDVEEQKQMIATLKAVRDAAATQAQVISVGVKRSLEDESEQITLNVQKPANPAELQLQRQIATNKRVMMTPTRKAAAWGALAFSLGLGAIAFMPNFL